MSLKKFLDNHPFPSIAITVAATGSLVAGIVFWIMVQKMEIKSERCEQDKQALQMDHKQKTDEMNWKLSSLERQIGSVKKYLEVTKLLIDDEKILKMKDSFQPYGNGSFYVAVPKSGLWRYNRLNKLEYLSLIYGEKSVLLLTPRIIDPEYPAVV